MTEAQEKDQQPRFGRAFNAMINADWLITEDAFRGMLEVATRLNPLAVDPNNQPDRSGWGYDKPSDDVISIRNGVAVIPVLGPIFRYANFFTYYCGGTSVDRLARNLRACLNDDAVTAIMFEINSPGGEVTGISEFAQQVFRARSKKPVTARVGGLGCSAAYWISSMCGDIAIDKTAMLGSIGVMAVYLDDAKNLEMRGFEEIEFISSQSPHKNAPPTTDEGKKRIQKRVDALAQVFVDAVAVGRGVSTKTVLEKFGQGDVFVGQAAIDAGLADRLGSFEETVRLLATTHTPGYVDTAGDEEPFPEPIPEDNEQDPDDDEYAAEKTINNSVPVKSDTVVIETASEPTTNTENNQGDLMSDKNTTDPNQPNAAVTDPASTAGGEPNPAPGTAAAPTAAAAAAPAKEEAGKGNEDVATLKQQVAEANERAEKANQRIEALETDARNKWIDDQVKEIGGEVATTKTVLTSLVSAYGQESDEVKTYVEQQKASVAQVNASGLFGEQGKSGANSDDPKVAAEAKLDKLAKDRVTASASTGNKLTYEQAYDAVLQENPDLAKEVV